MIKPSITQAPRHYPRGFLHSTSLYVPEMPKLRPNGAEAELMFVSRSLRFPINRGPHQDNVIKAMTDKYGTPSIHIKNLSSREETTYLNGLSMFPMPYSKQQGRSVRSRLSQAPCKISSRSGHMATGRMPVSFSPVTVSAECGMTVQSGTQRERRRLGLPNEDNRLRPATAFLAMNGTRTVKFSEARHAERKAKTKALKKRDMPDL